MPESRLSKIAGRVCLWLLIAGLLLSSVIGTGTDMTWQWPGYLLLGVAAICAVLVSGWRRQAPNAQVVANPAPRMADVCLVLAAIFCACVAVRAWYSPVAYFGREDAALAMAWFVVYALSSTVVGNFRQRISIIKVMTLLAIVNMGIGWYQFSGHQDFSIFPGAVRNYGERIGGVFFNPNHLAAFLAVVAPMLISLVVFGRGRPTYRALFAFVAAMSLLGIGMTRSRGGLLALSAGLGALLLLGLPLAWLFWKRHLSGRVGKLLPVAAVALVALLVGGAVFANGQALQQRFGANAFRLETNRQLFWQSALQQHEQAESPWIGAGSRAFRYEGRRLRSPQVHVSVAEAEFVHNDWLQLLADYGWVGMGLLSVMVVAHGGRALAFVRGDWRKKSRRGSRCSRPLQSNHLALVLGAVAGLVALAVHAVFDFHLHTPAVALWSAVLFGVLAAPRPEGEPLRVSSRSRSSSRSQSRSRIAAQAAAGDSDIAGSLPKHGPLLGAPVRALAVVSGLTLLVAGAGFVRSEWHFEKARQAFEGGDDFSAMSLVRKARQLDERNPYAHSLSGQAHLLAAAGDVALPEKVRREWLKKSGRHFMDALALYPQDIHAMMGLARALDGLGQNEDALRVLENAQLWAPLYGNIAQMRAEQWHVLGRYDEAQEAYEFARSTTAFGDSWAAIRGLALLEVHRSGGEVGEPMVATPDGEAFGDGN